MNGKNEHDDGPDCMTKMYVNEFEKKQYATHGGIRRV
jgi:hypothetical protein